MRCKNTLPASRGDRDKKKEVKITRGERFFLSFLPFDLQMERRASDDEEGLPRASVNRSGCQETMKEKSISTHRAIRSTLRKEREQATEGLIQQLNDKKSSCTKWTRTKMPRRQEGKKYCAAAIGQER